MSIYYFIFSSLPRVSVTISTESVENWLKDGRRRNTAMCSCASMDQAGKLKAQIHGNASTNLGKTAGHKLHYDGAELNKLPGCKRHRASAPQAKAGHHRILAG